MTSCAASKGGDMRLENIALALAAVVLAVWLGRYVGDAYRAGNEAFQAVVADVRDAVKIRR